MLKTFCHLHDEEGIFRFYVGGTLGVDMWAAEQLLYLKEQPGYQDIELIVALPFEGHDSKWDAMSKQRLQIIIHNATKCIVIGQSGTASDYKKRNYYMVDHADFLLAVHDIRITARDNTEECCHEVLNYLCEILEQEDFPRSYAVEFKGPEKSYLPITGLPKKGVNQLFACAVQYPGLHPLMERYARLAMRQYEQYTNLSDEQCALPGSFAVFALGMLGQEWRQLVWDYLDLCDDEHSHLQEKFLREYVKQFGFTADTVPVFVRGVLSMQNMKYSKDYAAWMANAESLDALLEAKIHLSEIVPSGFSSDEDDDDDENEEPTQETEASPEEVLQYAWETVCYVIWGKASAKGGQKVVETAPEELRERYQEIFQ